MSMRTPGLAASGDVSVGSTVYPPRDDDWKVQEASVLDDYAQLLERTKRIPDAENAYKQAQAIRAALAAQPSAARR